MSISTIYKIIKAHIKEMHGKPESKNRGLAFRIKAGFSLGYTIIELIVVVGIFAVIMSIALANQQALNNDLLITNLAYEIGLIVRKTQAYGIGVRGQTGGTSFDTGFGIQILLDGTTGKTDTITMFKDISADPATSGDITDATNQFFASYRFRNQRGNQIVALCTQHYAATDGPCTASSGDATNKLNIVFRRPNPEAIINTGTFDDSADNAKAGPAYIIVNTVSGKNCRAVIVESTGQVRIESANSATPACSNV